MLILGPPGAGKSDLLLRLIGRGWSLVADDRVVLDGLAVAPAPALAGMIEVRGLGIFEGVAVAREARLALVVELAPAGAVARLPEPSVWAPAGVPRVALAAFEASACDKVAWALEAALGRAAQRAGAFAA